MRTRRCRNRSHLVEVIAPVGVLSRAGRSGGNRRDRRRRRGRGALSLGRVVRDHLGHHLLAELDAILDEGEVDRGRRAFARQLLDPLLRLVPHEAGRDPEDPLHRVARPVEDRDQRNLLVVARHEP